MPYYEPGQVVSAVAFGFLFREFLWTNRLLSVNIRNIDKALLSSVIRDNTLIWGLSIVDNTLKSVLSGSVLLISS